MKNVLIYLLGDDATKGQTDREINEAVQLSSIGAIVGFVSYLLIAL